MSKKPVFTRDQMKAKYPMPARKTVKRLSKKEFLKKVIHGTLSADHVIAKMIDELPRYEQKYGMRSETFYALIAGTPAEDHPDFLQWATSYRSYFRGFQAKFPLKAFTGQV